MYQAGTIDIVGLGADDAIRLSNPKEPLSKELLTGAALCTSMISLDASRAPLDDINVRKALAYGLDYKKLATTMKIKDPNRATSILPPGMPGRTEREDLFPFSLEKAKAALAASKYAGKMPKIVIGQRSATGDASAFTNALVDQWRTNLGLQFEVKTVDPRAPLKSIRDTGAQITSHGWCADYPDPENFLDVLVHSGNDFNSTQYVDAKIDGMLEQARSEQDPARRIKLYQQAEELILTDVQVLLTSHSRSDMLVKPALKGYVLSPIGVRQLDRVTVNRKR